MPRKSPHKKRPINDLSSGSDSGTSEDEWTPAKRDCRPNLIKKRLLPQRKSTTSVATIAPAPSAGQPTVLQVGTLSRSLLATRGGPFYMKTVAPPQLKRVPPLMHDVDLHMECEEEELTDAQCAANAAADKQYQEALKAITENQQQQVAPPELWQQRALAENVQQMQALPVFIASLQQPTLLQQQQTLLPAATANQHIQIVNPVGPQPPLMLSLNPSPVGTAVTGRTNMPSNSLTPLDCLQKTINAGTALNKSSVMVLKMPCPAKKDVCYSLRKNNAENMKRQRLQESEDRTEKLRSYARDRMRRVRAEKSPDAASQSTRNNAEYMKRQRLQESQEAAAQRRRNNAEYMKQQRLQESEDQTEKLRASARDRMRKVRAEKSPEAAAQRRKDNAEYMKRQRLQEKCMGQVVSQRVVEFLSQPAENEGLRQ
ncbi:PREDICTED: uncharacterized protein LOC106807802 [Priapulus caudatus]|uniref:Uncharacterized protein LOC106807802 n=1 Tax=Priapulus caudatus TaxID=37621 RepID=A0ABM1E0M0_PRICU|nr:PREDICTED: uncharacterized protein LOC106807802 [Priapulus caudatus]